MIAVDPGLTGAVAVLHENGQPIDVFDMPVRDVGDGFVKREVDAAVLKSMVLGYAAHGFGAGQSPRINVRAVMERVTAMPGQGVSSMLSLGDSRGCARGVLEALDIAVEEVLPQRWKKALDLIMPKSKVKLSKQEKAARKSEAKAKSVALAMRLFPAFADRLRRAKDHGRAEALLIGRWATMGGA